MQRLRPRHPLTVILADVELDGVPVDAVFCMWHPGNPPPHDSNRLFLRDRHPQITLPNGTTITDRREMTRDIALWTGQSWLGGGTAARHLRLPPEQALLPIAPQGPAISLIAQAIRLPGRILPAGYYLARTESGIEIYHRIPEGRQFPERCWIEMGERAIAGWIAIP